MLNRSEQKRMCIFFSLTLHKWLYCCSTVSPVSSQLCTLIQAIHQFFDFQTVNTIGLITYSDTNLSNQLLKRSYYCRGKTFWPYTVNMNSFMVCSPPPKWHSLSWLIKWRLAWKLFPQGNVSIVVKRENATCASGNE